MGVVNGIFMTAKIARRVSFSGADQIYFTQGAVFISTLALTQLPEPERHSDGTQGLSQLQILATLIQPIVAFSVLGSILVRESYYFTLHPPNHSPKHFLKMGCPFPLYRLLVRYPEH